MVPRGLLQDIDDDDYDDYRRYRPEVDNDDLYVRGRHGELRVRYRPEVGNVCVLRGE